MYRCLNLKYSKIENFINYEIIMTFFLYILWYIIWLLDTHGKQWCLVNYTSTLIDSCSSGIIFSIIISL